MEPVLLKFVKGAGPYRAGELAGFAPDHADELLKLGVARKATREDLAAAAAVPVAPDAVPMLTSVRFVRHAVAGSPPAGYCAGDVAGFSAEDAQHLVERGFAELAAAGTTPAPAKAKAAGKAPKPLQLVRFIKSSPPYRVDDVAGFTAEKAAELVAAGVAVSKGEAAAPASAAASTDPPAGAVDPDAEVLGLDDRDPDWREKQKEGAKAPKAPPKDKMVSEPPARKGRG